jgi:hypothetical protein
MLFKSAFRTAIAFSVVVTGAATAFSQTVTTTRGELPRSSAENGAALGDDVNPLGDPNCMRNGRSPASLLLFPEFDNRFGKNTLLTLTNTDTNMASDPVSVELWYINEADCLKSDYTVTLTPGDTITLLTRTQHPAETRGYVFAFAKSGGAPVSNNVLIGQQVYLDGLGFGSLDWSVNAVGFKAVPARGMPTDIDMDGNKDLDGIEYEEAPDRIHIPRFLGQDGLSNSTMTFINLSGGVQFTTILDFAIYNDNEVMFSRQYQFYCWDKVRLTDISNVFTNSFLQSTNDDPNEILGATGQEAGWFTFEGLNAFSTITNINDPAVYGVLVEDRFGERVADLPWDEGCQDNGSLLPAGPLGDNSDQNP